MPMNPDAPKSDAWVLVVFFLLAALVGAFVALALGAVL